MGGPHPAVAAVRAAVRAGLADLPPGSGLLVALSGGADSLALLAATLFERPGDAGAVVVDHGWRPDSGRVARQVAARARELGARYAQVCRAAPSTGEAAARAARYAELDAAAARHGAAAVLLGHTRDDQAETVLLGLARGSGARSLAGMPRVRGLLRRPLLDLPRATTRAACAAAGLVVVEDPSNADPRHARARVRHRVLPVLEAELGPGVAAALARSAALLRDDADLLEAQARAVLAELGGELSCAALADLPPALRRRVLRAATPARTFAHVAALERLVTQWRGQGPVGLPGGVTAERRRGRILLTPPAGVPRRPEEGPP